MCKKSETEHPEGSCVNSVRAVSDRTYKYLLESLFGMNQVIDLWTWPCFQNKKNRNHWLKEDSEGPKVVPMAGTELWSGRGSWVTFTTRCVHP